MRLFSLVVALLTLSGCPAPMMADAGQDAPTLDAPLDAPVLDTSTLDAPDATGLDALAIDAPGDTPLDACVPACAGRECGDDGCGGTCGACLPGASCDEITGLCSCPRSTCGTATCGVSSCGRPCGVCNARQVCTAGVCVPRADCATETCTDRRGGVLCAGDVGLGECSTAPERDGVCTCAGGGVLRCDTCIHATVTGSACEADYDCPGGILFAVCTLGMCGETCSPPFGPGCAVGTCWSPTSSPAGVCLTPCACDVPGTCPPGTRCADSSDAFGEVISACVSIAEAAGRACTTGG